jgi:hypothetical protein
MHDPVLSKSAAYFNQVFLLQHKGAGSTTYSASSVPSSIIDMTKKIASLQNNLRRFCGLVRKGMAAQKPGFFYRQKRYLNTLTALRKYPQRDAGRTAT